MRPDEALLQPLQSPMATNVSALALQPRSPISVCTDRYHYRSLRGSDQQKTLQNIVVTLSRDLRRCYRKRILWPAEEPSP